MLREETEDAREKFGMRGEGGVYLRGTRILYFLECFTHAFMVLIFELKIKKISKGMFQLMDLLSPENQSAKHDYIVIIESLILDVENGPKIQRKKSGLLSEL